MKKTLEGVKVVDMCLAAAGPGCTRLLAEMGADVIWVETVNGTPTTRFLPHLDFYAGGGKRSLALNVKSAEGQEVLHRLIKEADVFVCNYRPAAMKKLGLTYEDLKAVNPQIIHATLTGWGEEGPRKDDAGYDVICFWAESGMINTISDKNGPMGAPISGAGDSLLGQALGMGICAALYHKEKTGEGMRIWTSLYSEALYAMNHVMTYAQLGTEYPVARTHPAHALYNSFQGSDGVWFSVLAPKSEHIWKLLEVIDRQDLIDDPVCREKWSSAEKVAYPNSAEFTQILDEGFAKMTAEEALRRLKEADIASTKIKTALEQTTPSPSEQALANHNMIKVHPWTNCNDQDIWLPTCPVKFDDMDPGEFKLTPKVGEHTVEILKELNYSNEEIKKIMDAGIAVETDGNGAAN